MSVTAFISYLKIERKYAAHTLVAYEKDLMDFKAYASLHFNSPEIDQLPYAVVRSWIVSLVAQELKPASINRKVASLKAYYKYLFKNGLIDKSPLTAHKALKTKKSIALPFSVKEMESVWKEEGFSHDFEGVRDQLIITLLYSTGMRRAELIGLQLVDVDLERKQIKVLGKRNKERIIPLLPRIIPMITEYLRWRATLSPLVDASYFLLLKSGKKLYETFVYRLINRYFSVVSTKLKKSPHMLRHTFATHLLNEGASMQAVKELLGHASLASTQVYTHTHVESLKKAYLASHPRSQKPK